MKSLIIISLLIGSLAVTGCKKKQLVKKYASDNLLLVTVEGEQVKIFTHYDTNLDVIGDTLLLDITTDTLFSTNLTSNFSTQSGSYLMQRRWSSYWESQGEMEYFGNELMYCELTKGEISYYNEDDFHLVYDYKDLDYLLYESWNKIRDLEIIKHYRSVNDKTPKITAFQIFVLTTNDDGSSQTLPRWHFLMGK